MSRSVPLAVAVLLASFSTVSSAGPFADELSKCMIGATTPSDRAVLVRWMFTSGASHPDLASIVQVTPEQVDASNKAVGELTMKLVTETCRDQAKKAIQFEGPTTFQTAFGALGQVAGTELYSNPDVTATMSGLQKYIDPARLQELTQ